MFDIAKLHYITQDHIEAHDHASLTKAACEGGVDWVQLRIKNLPKELWKREALKVRDICHRYNARLIINDHVELAIEIKADGVHLGKTDMDPVLAREKLGPGYIIGGTANSMDDILRLAKAKVDYIGIGPYRFTTTKENLSPVLGLEGFQKLIAACKIMNIKIPLIGIGGITAGDIPSLLNIGLHGVAVSSFINKAEDKSGAAVQIIEILHSSSIND